MQYFVTNTTDSWDCQDGGLTRSLIYIIYLCISTFAIFFNCLVLLSLAHLSHSSISSRFIGIRRSLNRGHPHFRFKRHRYSTSLRIRPIPNDEMTKQTSSNFISPAHNFKSDSYSSKQLTRSPSCPDRLIYNMSPNASFHAENSNYWLPQLNFENIKRFKSPAQARVRLTTALHFVLCLCLADLANALVFVITLSMSFWYPDGSFITTDLYIYQVEPVGSCSRLLFSCLQFTAYNASLLSISGLAIDLYLGVTHPMHYRGQQKRTLLKYTIIGGIISLLFGSNQLILPAITSPHWLNKNESLVTIKRHFLVPSEPCDLRASTVDVAFQGFCYLHGSANMYRSGFITGVLLIACSILINVLCAVALRRVKQQVKARQLKSKPIRCYQRSASLPMVNGLNGIVFSLHGLKAPLPQLINVCSSENGTTRQLLKSSVALLMLISLFLLCFIPSLVLEIYTIIYHFSRNHDKQLFPRWIYDIISNFPIISCLLNPIIYSIRLHDIRIGLQNFKKRMLAKSEKSFIRRQLSLHRDHIFPNSKITPHFRIKLQPK